VHRKAGWTPQSPSADRVREAILEYIDQDAWDQCIKIEKAERESLGNVRWPQKARWGVMDGSCGVEPVHHPEGDAKFIKKFAKAAEHIFPILGKVVILDDDLGPASLVDDVLPRNLALFAGLRENW
jgi:hypothetical protein